MAPLLSTERQLIDLALASVRRGLDGDGPTHVDTATLPPELNEQRGVFVTLLVDGELNGCVGTLFPTEPLGAAVARLAWDAAFADPRLPRLRWSDYERLSVKVSLLSPLQPLPPLTFEQLVESLQPGVDGLFIRIEGRQATFLPAVWEKLPDARAFVQQLQLKAGIPVGYWPSNAEAFTYTTREFSDLPH
jgi:AmmeMemoRadiSam system protein A